MAKRSDYLALDKTIQQIFKKNNYNFTFIYSTDYDSNLLTLSIVIIMKYIYICFQLFKYNKIY